MSTREIAVITAAPLLVRVAVTPTIGFAADRAGDHRRFLIALSWAGLAALVALAQSRGFWPILLCTLFFALAWTTIMPLTETVAMSGVRAAGLDYGRMRLWGSLSFIAATLAGGWVVEWLGPASAIWLVVAGGVLTTLAAHALARPIGLGRLKAATSPPRLSLAGALGLLRSRMFLLVSAGGRSARRPRTPCSTRSARCTGGSLASPRAGPARCGRSASCPRSACLPSRARCLRASARAR